MNTKHTPTPWHTEDNEGGSRKLVDADGEFISYISVSRYQDGRRDPVAKANAAHIVRCVNAHDELVALVRAITDNRQHCYIPTTGGPKGLDALFGWDDRADAALAKVAA